VSKKGESVLELPDISKQAKQLEERLLWLKTSAYRDIISGYPYIRLIEKDTYQRIMES